MRTRTVFFSLVVAFISVSAFAQDIDNKDYDIGGSGGGNNCYTCSGTGTIYAACLGHTRSDFGGSYTGYDSCTPHQSPIGGFCEISGYCAWYDGISFKQSLSTTPLAALNTQASDIEAFLRASKLMGSTATDDFIAETDFKLRDEDYATAARHRLDAYRAKFAGLTGHELKPGYVPVMPHKQTKAAAATIAAR